MKKWTCFLILFLFGCHPPIVPYMKLVKDQETISSKVQARVSTWVNKAHDSCLEEALLLDQKTDRLADYNSCMKPTVKKAKEYEATISRIHEDLKTMVTPLLEKKLPDFDTFDYKIRGVAEELRKIGTSL